MTAAANVPSAPYETRPPASGDVLLLDRNEGPRPPSGLLDALRAADLEVLRRYPATGELEALLARRLGVGAEQVLVTAGADDAIDRCCRAFLDAERPLLLAVPTFLMIERFAQLTGCRTKRVPWMEGAFPVSPFLAAADASVGMAAIVSPNNPTGAALTRDELDRLATGLGETPLLLDCAYVEYADEDLTMSALAHENVIVVRTLSKAWGLAGCRVGYALGSPDVTRMLRSAGAPYPVAGPSVAIAAARLRGAGVDSHVAQVRRERERLRAQLAVLKVITCPSQANFVLASFGERAAFVRGALLAAGVLVRDFSSRPLLEGCLRISLPGDEAQFDRLSRALELALDPQALLFDLDGVLADVRESYRRAIIETAAAYGVTVDGDDVARIKARGNANDDWELTRELLAERGVERSLSEVTREFQARYLGRNGRTALRERERLTVSSDWLRRLGQRVPLAIVTGRPRAEAEWLLERENVRGCFTALVCREDAPLKPDPAPVREALKRLGVTRGWMLGDTPDDVRAARAAGVIPIGVVAPGEHVTAARATLTGAGAACVLDQLEGLEALWT